MVEVFGDLWTYPNADARVITTNGTVKKNGECVMGRGCASEAATRWPEIPKMLGDWITAQGNRVVLLTETPDGKPLYTFPVKHHWTEKADIDLIRHSAEDLAACVGNVTVVMPRPGCGNGRLKWDDVKLVLTPILDDRFHVITFK